MDILTVLDDFRKRISHLETDSVEMHDRMGKVEDKCSGAWKTINEQKTEIRELREDMRQMRTKLESVEIDVKDLKLTNTKNSRLLKVIIALLSVCLVICGAFFIYIWKHDAELARAVLSLGSTIATNVAL